jgi:hypothetical protein
MVMNFYGLYHVVEDLVFLFCPVFILIFSLSDKYQSAFTGRHDLNRFNITSGLMG